MNNSKRITIAFDPVSGVYRECIAIDDLTHDQINQLIAERNQAVEDRRLLAAEVMRWRQLSSCKPGDEIDCAADRVDASGALGRAFINNLLES
jgi:hypothetical protein